MAEFLAVLADRRAPTAPHAREVIHAQSYGLAEQQLDKLIRDSVPKGADWLGPQRWVVWFGLRANEGMPDQGIARPISSEMP